MWRYIISKIINWWYWLAIFGFIFVAAHNVYAENYFQNFDYYSNNTLLKTISNWAGITGYITESKNYSYPNSASATSSASNVYTTTYNIATTSLYVLWNVDNKQSCAAQRFGFCMSSGSYADNLYLYNVTGAPISLKGKSTLSKNVWYHVQTEYNKDIQKARINWNNEGWSSWYTTATGGTSTQWSFQSNIDDGAGGLNGIYVDNLSINNGTSFISGQDYAHFVIPKNNDILDPRAFLWNYQFSISTSTYWTTYNNLGIYVVYDRMVNGIAASTTTVLLYLQPMNTFIPGVLYDGINQETANLPTVAGLYYAVIGLYGDSVLLAYDTVTFGIATSTLPNNNAWCEDLCTDLTLSSATTTAVWGIPIPWLEPHFLNDGFCGIRYASCYLFYPTAGSIDVIQDDLENIKETFPVNVYFQLASTTSSALSTSTNMNGTFSMPYITKAGKATMLPVLSSSSIPNAIGLTNSNTFRNTIGWLIWLIIACCCLLSLFFIL